MADADQRIAELEAQIESLTKKQEKLNKSTTNVTGAIGGLYATVKNSKANIEAPFSQAGVAVGNIANVAKSVVGKFIDVNGKLGGFLDIVGKGAEVMGKHQQRLLDFGHGLKGSAALSIDSFSELHANLAKANLGLDDFTAVQSKAANFLSTMGGKFRGTSGQVQLLSDITNRVNDDFEKLGQAGLSLKEKQDLQGESMDTLRSIGMAAGTTSAEASAMVSKAMQGMAMESNKMAALTGADRRDTLAAMTAKAKSDTDVLVSGKMLSDRMGHTAEQTLNVRQSMAGMGTMFEAMGPAGETMKAAFHKAAEAGIPFETVLADLDPQLFAMVQNNKKYMDGMQGLLTQVEAGEKVEVEDFGAVQKDLEGSITKGMASAATMSGELRDKYRSLMLATVKAGAFSQEGAENVETQMGKMKDTAMGAAGNMSQAMKDALTASQNAAEALLTVGTEVFNDKFKDDVKSIRDTIKEMGTYSTETSKLIRDDIMGVHEYGDMTNAQMRIYLAKGLSHEEARMQVAKDMLADQMQSMGFSKEMRASIQSFASHTDEEILAQQKRQKDAYSKSNAALDSMTESLSGAKAMTVGELQTMADALGVNVEALTAQAGRMGIAITDAAGLTKEGATVANTVANNFEALNAEQKANFTMMLEGLAGGRKMADAQYDKLINNIINSKEVQLSDETKGLFSKIAGSDQSQAIVDLLKQGIQVNTGDTENDRLATSIDELITVLKGQAGKTPNITVSKSPEEMTMWEDMKKSWKQIQEDLSN